jgi:S1-C subfamily serine protease
MKKLYFMLLFLFIFNIAFSEEVKIKDLYKKTVQSVVTIYTNLDNNNYGRNREGIGSGVVISEDGKILTAAHVLDSSELYVQIEFEDGNREVAEIIASDAISDIALLKLKHIPKNLKPAKLGDSDKMSVGDKIIIIGSPYGISKSLSVGYISGRSSNIIVPDSILETEYFQTDAAINKGNSGGAMFNMKGEVVGIVSSIITQSGGFEGIGFAITINSAKKNVLDQMVPWFGIKSIIISGELAKALNIGQKTGLLVQSVSKGSMADLSNIQPGYIPTIINNRKILIGGDVILSIMGVKIKDLNSFKQIREKLLKTKKQSKIPLTIMRNGRIINIDFLRSF